MVRVKFFGKIKPDTWVCLRGKKNLYLVEDGNLWDKDWERVDDPQVGESYYVDEWFWSGDMGKLAGIFDVIYHSSYEEYAKKKKKKFVI